MSQGAKSAWGDGFGARFREVFFATLLLAATMLAYQPAWHGRPIWDDDAHLTKPALRSLHGLARIWIEPGATQQYYPLVHSIFWLEHPFWGETTLGYHLVNILLHGLSCLLLWCILRRLAVPGAWLAAAIFALHPIEVESVAWISELKNTLSGALYLGAALAYLEFDRRRGRAAYAGALGLFVLGLMAKSVIATLPAALLVIFWWHRGRLAWRTDVRPLMPFFAVGAAAGIFTAWVERTFIGANGAEFAFSLGERVLIAGRVFWFYLGKILWPADLMFIYPRWTVDGREWWQWLFPVAAFAFVASLWMLRKRARWPLAAVLFFGGTLFPALGFLNVYPFRFSLVADHFQYLAGLAPITVAAAGLATVAARGGRALKFGSCAGTGALLLVLGVLTWNQTRIYADFGTIWRATLAKNPGCWLARNNLGTVLLYEGRLDEAIASYRAAWELKPDYAEAHYNAGNAYARKGRPAEALAQFEQALALQPDYPEVFLNRGVLLAQQGRTDDALRDFLRGLASRPDYAEAHYNAGIALFQRGRAAEAIAHFERAVAIRADYEEAHRNLAVALVEEGRLAEAIPHYRRVLEINPRNAAAANELAWLYATCPLASLRNGPHAVELARRANETGENPLFLRTLAAACAENGRFSEAEETARHALSLVPEGDESGLRAALEAELAGYRAGAPYRDETFKMAPRP